MNDISLIIPYYNREENFDKMLNSLRSLKVKPNEIIFVNNGASDEMAKQINSFCAENIGICTILTVNCLKPGACAARNLGVKNATCDYVYFFDSDDEISPYFFEEVHHDIKKTRLDLYVYITRVIESSGHVHVRKYGYSSHPSYQILSSFLTTQSMVIRKEFLLEIGGWDEEITYWNDWELGIRMLLNSPRMKYFSGRYYHNIYVHKNSITGSSFTNRFVEINKVLDIVYSEINDKKSQKALYYRKAIISGKISMENRKDLAKILLEKSFKQEPSTTCKLICFLLYLMVSHNVPGVWKLATKLL